MSQTKALPTNLIEAIRYFSNLHFATGFVAELRWPDGPVCPRCEGTEHSYLTTRQVWKCKGCKKQVSVKVGTVFEDSPLGLDKWLPAVWLIANSKNGISPHVLGRALGVTQKSAWFMLHRIRLAMQTGTFPLACTAEVDETFIGGKARNMPRVRKQKITGTGARTRPPSSAWLSAVARFALRWYRVGRFSPVSERESRRDRRSTQTLPSYSGLDQDYVHEVVDHGERYVDGQVHTNYMEIFWAQLKRGLHGTYISVQPFHLYRYIDERVLTFNLRELDDHGRFRKILQAATGRRLTYAELTGH